MVPISGLRKILIVSCIVTIVIGKVIYELSVISSMTILLTGRAGEGLPLVHLIL